MTSVAKILMLLSSCALAFTPTNTLTSRPSASMISMADKWPAELHNSFTLREPMSATGLGAFSPETQLNVVGSIPVAASTANLWERELHASFVLREPMSTAGLGAFSPETQLNVL